MWRLFTLVGLLNRKDGEGRGVKLGDGRKVTMHKTPECAKRNQLRTETSRLLAEWLASKDEVRLISKKDPLYTARIEEMNAAGDNYKAAESKLSQQTLTHGCW